MARRISGVGRVTVSERRSTTAAGAFFVSGAELGAVRVAMADTSLAFLGDDRREEALEEFVRD
jgi:hypothetical protein